MSIFKRKSASNFFVRDLRPGSDNFVIKRGCSLEMVLVDQEGDRIQATVEKFFAKYFRKDLVEGRSVLINTFKVVEYNSEYRTTRTPFKIVFYATTTVSICLDFLQEVPEKYMKSFPDILSNDLDNGYLIDVVGQIVRVGHVEDIYLRDESDLQLPCTLWADYTKEVADYVKRNCASVVVMSISNAFNTTHILFDPVCPLVAKFRSDKQVGKYVTLATIRSVANSNSWYYIACKKCEKRLILYPRETMLLRRRLGNALIAIDNSSGLPQSLRDLEGKEFLFKVVVTEDNVKKVKNSFSVDRFTSDDYMIQTSVPPFLETFVDEDRGSHVEKTLPACSKSDCDDPHVSVDVNAEDSIEKIVPASSKSDCDAPNDIVKRNTNVTLEKTAPVGSKRDPENPDVIPTPVKTPGSRRKKNSMS
ncbi:hypothetical protein EUTSA_v10029157mg [Eutrema salsugineum]|uniref:Replication protein A 70 kDa DNA-binding subunit B/D first OB fold domain-containing protein n=1 Tax=Eutrema salsugineum TaxID=72664 RepID=V4L8W8_EUTSA|nr:hypothetical protein EUTSA_v10029157mg [Eutrema salsugineum]